MRRKAFEVGLKIMLSIVLVAVVGGSAYIVYHWSALSSFPKVLPSYYAKQYCSCFYVMGQSPKYCHNWTRQWAPISDFQHNEESQEIFVTAFRSNSRAKFISDKKGCRIIE